MSLPRIRSRTTPVVLLPHPSNIHMQDHSKALKDSKRLFHQHPLRLPVAPFARSSTLGLWPRAKENKKKKRIRKSQELKKGRKEKGRRRPKIHDFGMSPCSRPCNHEPHFLSVFLFCLFSFVSTLIRWIRRVIASSKADPEGSRNDARPSFFVSLFLFSAFFSYFLPPDTVTVICLVLSVCFPFSSTLHRPLLLVSVFVVIRRAIQDAIRSRCTSHFPSVVFFLVASFPRSFCCVIYCSGIGLDSVLFYSP